jgi:AraC-like DNA-binding protein
MDRLQANKDRITHLLTKLTVGEGIRPSILEGVKLMRAERSFPRVQVMYDPSIVIVGRGRKRGYVGEQCFTYDRDNYLVLSLPMPFECETEAGPDGPMVAVSVRVELPTIAELLMQMEHKPVIELAEDPLSMYATPLDEKLSDATARLLECLQNPEEAQIMGTPLVREMTYRVLLGPQGGALRSLISMNSRVSEIHRAVQRMHFQYDEQLDVATLASSIGMSQSLFHHAFKSVTGTSPLQYLKTIRLHKAKAMIVHEGMGAREAAERVGYESASQFSREFKRFFGESPRDQAMKERAMLGLQVAQR